MHHGGPLAARRHRARPGEERGLTDVTFVGSYPTPDFHLTPSLPEIAFLGRSNVGKSSLINAVVARRAIARTSRTPGKTQLCNVFRFADRFYLVDLPGYGYAQASHDRRKGFRALIEGYLRKRDQLAGAVWLLDIRRAPSPEDLAMAELLTARGIPVLAAITKADKVTRGRRDSQLQAILEALALDVEQAVLTSAITKQGIDEVRETIDELVKTATNAHS